MLGSRIIPQPVEGHFSEKVLPLGFDAAWKKYVFQGGELYLEGDIGVDGKKNDLSDRDGVPTAVEGLIEQYQRVGDDFLKALKGGFRLALWDGEKRKLLVAADPFATRPIYYGLQQGVIAFAPTISALAHVSACTREIDFNVIYFYLNHSFIPAPHTIYRDIRRLEPGHYFVWHGGNLKTAQYWDIEYHEDHALTENAAATMVYSEVEKSLRFYRESQSCDNKEIGAFLSGGTDSSTLVGLLAKMQDEPVRTFSVGFQEEAYNEIHYARIAAKHFGAEAHEYFVSPEDVLMALPILAKSYDEPFGNSSAIPTYFCLRLAKEAGVKVMFAGDAGDELFAGNERYLAEKYFFPFDVLPKVLQSLSTSIARSLPRLYPFGKIRRYIERASEPNPERFFHYQLFFSRNAHEFFSRDFMAEVHPEFPLRAPRYHYGKVNSATALNRLLYMDLKMCIADNDLFKVNRMAESLGIKICYPYLDRDLAELTGKIPVGLKLKAFEKRYIFKKAFETLLPDKILRKQKHGFGLPIAHWLRSHAGFREMARSLLFDSSALQRGHFNREALEKLLCQHDDEKGDFYGTFIWNLMMLELWTKNHQDRLYRDRAGQASAVPTHCPLPG